MSSVPLSKAYAFHSDLSLDEMFEILKSKSSLTWKGGDNDVWGEYLRTHLRDDLTKLRIFVDGSQYVVDIYHIPKAPESIPREEAVDTIENIIFPLVGARDVEPHPGWEG
jgi:hypothetical protein